MTRRWNYTCVAWMALAGLALAQSTTRISTSSTGVPGDAPSSYPNLSGDGTLVAFSSYAANLVSGGLQPGGTQVYTWVRATGAISLVSLNSSGVVANAGCWNPILSRNGRFVVFDTEATNFGVPDTNNTEDTVVRDLTLGVSTCVSVTPGGTTGNGYCHPNGVSEDGRFVVFESTSSDLVAGDSNALNGAYDVFVRDVVLGTTEMVSVSSLGVQGQGRSITGSISADGRYVVFSSDASNLVPNDTNGTDDVFLRDRLTGVTTRISEAPVGVQADGSSGAPRISADAKFVVFISGATNLVPGDTNACIDIFELELATGAIERVSVSSSGAQANSHSYGPASISADGRYVGFNSSASNLVPPPANVNHLPDAFVHDRQTGVTWRASQDSFGSPANGGSDAPQISDDGQVCVYGSSSSNLVAGDDNYWFDIFLTDLAPLGVVSTYGTAKTNSNGCVSHCTTVGFPRATGPDDAFVIASTNALNKKSGIFFWGRQPANLPFGGGWLLVKPPIVRTGVQPSGGSANGTDCTGAYTYRFTQSYMASNLVLAGDTLYGQFWSRDPGYAPPNNIGLSNAVVFVVSP